MCLKPLQRGSDRAYVRAPAGGVPRERYQAYDISNATRYSTHSCVGSCNHTHKPAVQVFGLICQPWSWPWQGAVVLTHMASPDHYILILTHILILLYYVGTKVCLSCIPAAGAAKTVLCMPLSAADKIQLNPSTKYTL
jgi:hypothetical protein